MQNSPWNLWVHLQSMGSEGVSSSSVLPTPFPSCPLPTKVGTSALNLIPAQTEELFCSSFGGSSPAMLGLVQRDVPRMEIRNDAIPFHPPKLAEFVNLEPAVYLSLTFTFCCQCSITDQAKQQNICKADRFSLGSKQSVLTSWHIFPTQGMGC